MYWKQNKRFRYNLERLKIRVSPRKMNYMIFGSKVKFDKSLFQASTQLNDLQTIKNEWHLEEISCIEKEGGEKPIPDSFKPMSCLLIILKLFTEIIPSLIYDNLKEIVIASVEHKGTFYHSCGPKISYWLTKWEKKLFMAYHRKAFDAFFHSWVKKMPESFFGTNRNIRRLPKNISGFLNVFGIRKPIITIILCSGNVPLTNNWNKIDCGYQVKEQRSQKRPCLLFRAI